MWQDHARALDHRLQPPRAATIRFRGETLVGRSAEQIVRSGVGLVRQGQRIFPSFTVREQLAIAERRSAGTEWTVGRVLEVFGAPRPADAQGNRLSGGEQQMLAIARALVTEGLSPRPVNEVAAKARRTGPSRRASGRRSASEWSTARPGRT